MTRRPVPAAGRQSISPRLLFGLVVVYAVVGFLGWVLSGVKP